jgi:hypothetical protein
MRPEGWAHGPGRDHSRPASQAPEVPGAPERYRGGVKRVRHLAVGIAAAALLVGCGSALDAARGEPSASPTDFAGLVRTFADRDLAVSGVVSGDPGCDDHHLAPMAISFHIAGGAESLPLIARAYRFRNDEAYQRLRESVDACATQWVTSPNALLVVDASPYVLFVDGATDEAFKVLVRAALNEAAGK